MLENRVKGDIRFDLVYRLQLDGVISDLMFKLMVDGTLSFKFSLHSFSLFFILYYFVDLLGLVF